MLPKSAIMSLCNVTNKKERKTISASTSSLRYTFLFPIILTWSPLHIEELMSFISSVSWASAPGYKQHHYYIGTVIQSHPPLNSNKRNGQVLKWVQIDSTYSHSSLVVKTLASEGMSYQTPKVKHFASMKNSTQRKEIDPLCLVGRCQTFSFSASDIPTPNTSVTLDKRSL